MRRVFKVAFYNKKNPKKIKSDESVPTRRTLCEFLLNLGEMPLPRLVVIEQIQNGKEGLTRI